MNCLLRFAVCVLVMVSSLLPVKAVTVTINYADELAHDALMMIFNITQFRSIPDRDVFEVQEGDNIRFSVNTYDYNVSIDGEELQAAANQNYTTWTTGPITSDRTITLSATSRDYGTTFVAVALLDPEGVVLRAGTPDGDTIDISSLTPVKSGDMYVYMVPVSLKLPKVFVFAAPGYWIKDSYIGSDQDIVYTIMSTNDGNTLYVYDYKLDADGKIVYRVMCGNYGSFKGAPNNAVLVDNSGNVFEAVEGYNVYDVDLNYVSPMTIRPMNVDAEDSSIFSIYLNGAAVAADKDRGTYVMDITSDAVIYAFIGRQAPVRRTISIIKPDYDNSTSIVYDKVMKVNDTATSFSVFNTAEIAVCPAEGMDVYLDDELLTLNDGIVTFSANKNCTIEIRETDLSGITSVECSDSEALSTVVSIDGVIVLKNATIEQVGELPPGFYIVNGKKTFIRK